MPVIATFADFVSFFFGGGAVAFQRDCVTVSDPMYDAQTVVRFYSKLFSESCIVLRGYERSSVDAGFAAMVDPNVPMCLMELIWQANVPLNLREKMIMSIVSLYRDFFDHDPLFGTPFMWWDRIAYDFECGNRQRSDNFETARLQDCIMDALVQILSLPSIHSQRAALHGLGHLHHPRTREVIERYLARRIDVSPDLAGYARQAAAGLIE